MFYMPFNMKFISVCMMSSISNVCLQEVVVACVNGQVHKILIGMSLSEPNTSMT